MEIKNEKYLYQENKVPYKLKLTAIALAVLYIIIILNNMHVDLTIGIFVMISIIYMLVGCLCAVKIKMYDGMWAKISILMGLIQILRFTTVPMYLDPSMIVSMRALIIASGVFSIAAGVMTMVRGKQRKKAREEQKRNGGQNGQSH